MIRNGGWRDVGLLQRLAPRGACLCSKSALTDGARVLQKGLAGLVAPSRRVTTLVWRGGGEENKGFAQMHLEGAPNLARVYFLAPTTPETHPRRTSALLNGLAREAGGRGAHNLIAEANEGSPEYVALRSAGFVVYARQQLYRMLSRPVLAKPILSLNLCDSRDEIAAQRLYSNIVPALVRRFEPDPIGVGGWYFLNSEDDDDIMVLLGVTVGPKGTWVQPYVHPEAEESIGDVLAAFLFRGETDSSKCNLQEMGFQLLGQQAVMVKRLTASIKKYKPVPAVVSTDVDVSAPVGEISILD